MALPENRSDYPPAKCVALSVPIAVLRWPRWQLEASSSNPELGACPGWELDMAQPKLVSFPRFVQSSASPRPDRDCRIRLDNKERERRARQSENLYAECFYELASSETLEYPRFSFREIGQAKELAFGPSTPGVA